MGLSATTASLEQENLFYFLPDEEWKKEIFTERDKVFSHEIVHEFFFFLRKSSLFV